MDRQSHIPRKRAWLNREPADAINSPPPARQIWKKKIVNVHQTVFNAPAKDPKEQHIPEEMEDSPVQEHAGNNWQQCDREVPAARCQLLNVQRHQPEARD